MSDELPQSGGELLRTLGNVRMPEPQVLDDAREVLWSAINEMLGIGASGAIGEQAAATEGSAGRGSTRGEEDRRRRVRRRQMGLSRDGRRMSMGGGDS